MQFVDKAFARRLESGEEMPQVLYARSFQKTRPEIRAAEEQICGGHMVFAGLGSPIGRATGVGLDRPFTVDDLNRVEQFYRAHKAPSQVDLCPLHEPGIFEMFHAEIMLDDRAQLPPLRSPCRGRHHSVRHFLKASNDRIHIEVLLAFKMPVETAVRQPQVFHQPRQTLSLKALFAERPRGSVDNPFVCFRFLFDGISHLHKIISVILQRQGPAYPG